uniref:Uncharacterized protein n=1 Tax=Myripristis murdjan TaxID=586833 RepID=A0A667WGI8_9TELE
LKSNPCIGECVLTVHLNDEEVCCAEGMEAEVEFYLLFSGSKQQHLTTTLRVSRVTLQAMCPAHDVCEQVLVTLCSARPDGMVVPHSQESFYYVQNQFLLSIFVCQVSLKECERLDHSLVLALKHLSLLYKWTSCQQQPTLLHLAASHGLKRVASFLLKQPGGREALRKTDAHGQTPVCLAKSKGHQHLLELFTQ